jgi:hypothetical protein
LTLCSGIRRDGGRCQAPAMRDSAYCLNHDPSRAAQNRRNAAKAGRAGGRGRPRRSGEIGEIKDKLRKIADDLLDPKAKLPRGDAAVAIQAYAAVMNCIRTELKQREQEELVERLESLESALAARKQGYGYGA